MTPIKLGLRQWVSQVFFPSFLPGFNKKAGWIPKLLQRVQNWENSVSSHCTEKRELGPTNNENKGNPQFYFFSQKFYSSVPKLLWHRYPKPQENTNLSGQRKPGRENTRWAWNILWCQKVKQCSEHYGGIFKGHVIQLEGASNSQS